MSRIIIFSFLLTLTSTSASAGFKSSECKTTDWYQKGLQEGAKGIKIDQLYRYIKTCDRIGVEFSADDYRRGRMESFFSYCSNENAYNLGVNKKKIGKSVCDSKTFPDFRKYYNNGLSVSKLNKEAKKLNKKISSFKKYLTKLDKAESQLAEVNEQINERSFNSETMANTRINKPTSLFKNAVSVVPDPGVEKKIEDEVENLEPALNDPDLNDDSSDFNDSFE